jgi:hypothetical protein
MKIPRKTVVEQLITYCHLVDRDGSYYGNRDQWKRRHTEAVLWLNEILEGYDK